MAYPDRRSRNSCSRASRRERVVAGKGAVMTLRRPRATGYYATFVGREYQASTQGQNVILRSYNGEPPPVDFVPSRIPSVQGTRTVQRSELENLVFVRTVCRWQGEPFT